MRRSAMRRAVLAVVALAVAGVPATSGSPAVSAEPGDLDVPEETARSINDSKVEQTYIVTMLGEPAVTYEGGVSGFPATSPDGGKLETDSSNVVRYRQYLTGRHNQALAAAGLDAKVKLYDYSVATNGFAARINGRQAEALRKQKGVLSVERDQKYSIDTISTPDFLGLTGSGGAWSNGFVGEDVIVGIIDTGVWPENRSFSDKNKNGAVVYDTVPQWTGTCQTGEGFTAADCNKKLIGARYFNAGWGGNAGIKASFPYEYNSPRDADGHGSHTGSTAAGNGNVPVTIEGENYGRASGMAPRARVATYKVCWGRGDEGGCFGADSVAAIDSAIADHVDVLNFSISGTSTNFGDPVELAFMRASNAGIFVAASAGNSGPTASTVAHPSPWLTTVAASTHDRYSQARLLTGNGKTYTGASIQSTGTGELPLIYAGDAALPTADPEEAALCFPDTLDPTAVDGHMVICDRGVNARTEKSLTVRDAGGEAMVLVNTSPNSINADIHFVPSIHLDAARRPALLAYAATDGATGTLTPGKRIVDQRAPQTAAFSSRGPLLASSDLLKPDITAPGVDVLAAVSPDGYYGRNYDLLSGTSMSSPHIAGLAAVLRDAHPKWGPSAFKSAMMTTAYDVEDASPFDVGSGHIDINRAVRPDLVYPAAVNDWIGFLCGQGVIDQPALCYNNTIAASDLNQPNIAIGELAGTRTVTRRIRNITSQALTFNATVEAPEGINVTVSPSALRINPGQTRTYRVNFESNASAVYDEYAFGKITWLRTGGRRVESDLAVRPVALQAPDEVSGTGVAGSDEFDITFGYTGPYTAAAHGLEPAAQQNDTVTDDPGNDINGALDCYFGPGGSEALCGITLHDVEVPAGTAVSRFSLFDEFTDGADDLDMYVFDPDGFNVGASGSGTSAEQVDLADPVAGTYTVIVHGWQTDGPSADYTLFSWSVFNNPAAGSNTLVIDAAPPAAVVGETGTVEYSWSGLAPNNKYLGAVSHNNATEIIDLTLVSVDAYAAGG